MGKNLEFYERQRYAHWWLWILLIGINIPFAYGIREQIFGGNPWGNNPMSDIGLIATTAFVFLISIAVLFSFLETSITKHGIYIRYFPFNIKAKYFDWEDIQDMKIIHFNPIWKYGGYGIRTNHKGTAYIVKGKAGLSFNLKGRKKIIVIGTQKANEIKLILKEFGKLDL